MQAYYDVVVNSGGNPVNGASVFVYDAAGTLATIYQSTAPIVETVLTSNGTPYYLSQDLVTPQVNPITTGADGRYIFFAENGVYTVVITANGYNSRTFSVALYDTTTRPSPTYSVVVTPPNDAVNVSAIGANVGTTDGDLALYPKGTGAVLGQVPTSTASGGNKRGASAVDWQLSRLYAAEVASGLRSVIAGGHSNKASNDYAAVGGGTTNYATGTYSVISGGLGNIASGSYSSVIGGSGNLASGITSAIGGGENNQSTNFDSTVAGGSTNQATGIASTVGGGSGNQATGNQSTVAGGSSNLATNSQATIGGGRFNAASGQYATIAGGEEITASGNYSFVGSGQLNSVTATHGAIGGGQQNSVSSAYAGVHSGLTNTASGSKAFVGGGESNTASAGYTAITGGYTNAASGLYASVIGGSTNTASGASSVVAGGSSNTASGVASAILGGIYGTTKSITGYAVIPASNSPIEAKAGVSQSGVLVLGVQTTDATSTKLRSNTSVASTTNQLVLADNSAITVSGNVVATKTGGGDTAGWVFTATAKRGANAASTTLIASNITEVGKDAGASAWAIDVDVDTTNGALYVSVTGQASTTIRWVATLYASEVGY